MMKSSYEELRKPINQELIWRLRRLLLVLPPDHVDRFSVSNCIHHMSSIHTYVSSNSTYYLSSHAAGLKYRGAVRTEAFWNTGTDLLQRLEPQYLQQITDAELRLQRDAAAERQRQIAIRAQEETVRRQAEVQRQAALRAQQEAARLAEAALRAKLQREQTLAQEERQRDDAIQTFRAKASRLIVSLGSIEQHDRRLMACRLNDIKTEQGRRLMQIKNTLQPQRALQSAMVDVQLKIIEMQQAEHAIKFQLGQLEQAKLNLAELLHQIQSEFTQASHLATQQYHVLSRQYNTDSSGDSQWWAVLSLKRDNRLRLSASLNDEGQRAADGVSQRIKALQNEQNQLQQVLVELRARLNQAQITLTEAFLVERHAIIDDETRERCILFQTAAATRDRLHQHDHERLALANQQARDRQTILDESLTGFTELMNLEVEQRRAFTWFETQRRAQSAQNLQVALDQLIQEESQTEATHHHGTTYIRQIQRRQ